MTQTPEEHPATEELPPSLAWATRLSAADLADFLADVVYGADRGLPELVEAMRLWWVFAKNHGDAPAHALPVVDQAAVTAPLDGAETDRRLNAIYELRRLTSPAGERCHNCFGPGPLVPHLYGMRVCQRCFPEPDAFAAIAEDGA